MVFVMGKIRKNNLIVLEKLVDARKSRIATKKTSGHHLWMTIHQRIKQRRLALALSMEQLAEMVGVKSWQTVQQWEREGGTAPKRTRLQKVAAALKVTPEWLMHGNTSELSESEAEMLRLYRLLNPGAQKLVWGVMDSMLNPGGDEQVSRTGADTK